MSHNITPQVRSKIAHSRKGSGNPLSAVCFCAFTLHRSLFNDQVSRLLPVHYSVQAAVTETLGKTIKDAQGARAEETHNFKKLTNRQNVPMVFLAWRFFCPEISKGNKTLHLSQIIPQCTKIPLTCFPTLSELILH